MELFYVFNNWENATLGSGILFRPGDDSVQNAMLNYLVNFARTGNPNEAGLPSWPQYQSPSDCFLDIKALPNGSACGLRTPQSNLWDDVTGYLSDNTAPYSVQPGNWHNEATWNTYRVPDATSAVIIRHTVMIDKDGTCKSLSIEQAAVVQLLDGVRLTILK